MMTAEEFKTKVGREPENDDLERVNCKAVGDVGHAFCGWCPRCDLPRFMCSKPIEHLRKEEINHWAKSWDERNRRQ